MPFEYLEPTTIEEAVSLLCVHNGRAKVIAGGTELLVQIRNRVTNPEYLIDISGIADLDYINHDKTLGLRIGALTPIRSIEKSTELKREFSALSKAASQLGSVAIRNVGTIGGNLCNATPSAETAPALIGLSAKVKIAGLSGERLVPLEDFFTGPGTTVLGKAELLVEIQVPISQADTRSTYYKHAPRGTIDPSIVSVAAIATVDSNSAICTDLRIVLGAVAPTPMRARQAEDIIRGKKPTESLIFRSAEIAAKETRPISDVRASAEYRREMVKVFTRRALNEVLA